MDYHTARKKALRLLSLRNYHTDVLKRKLVQKGCAEEVAERVIVYCKELGFIDDERAILRELQNGLGPRAIEYKLGIKRSEIRKWITRDKQKAKIEELIGKFETREKAFQTLRRKGFDLDIVIEIFSLKGVEW